MSSYGFLAGLPTLLTCAPSCFTIGEAVVVVHCVILFVYGMCVNLCHVAFFPVPLLGEMDISPEASYAISTIILQVQYIFSLKIILKIPLCGLFYQKLFSFVSYFFAVTGGHCVHTDDDFSFTGMPRDTRTVSILCCSWRYCTYCCNPTAFILGRKPSLMDFFENNSRPNYRKFLFLF